MKILTQITEMQIKMKLGNAHKNHGSRGEGKRVDENRKTIRGKDIEWVEFIFFDSIGDYRDSFSRQPDYMSVKFYSSSNATTLFSDQVSIKKM